jgi:hypothetical protein
MNVFLIKVRKKGQMEMDKNLISHKVYVKIYLSIWLFLRTFIKKAFNYRLKTGFGKYKLNLKFFPFDSLEGYQRISCGALELDFEIDIKSISKLSSLGFTRNDKKNFD